MEAVFLKVLNMSLSAGVLILAVLILRLILWRAPKWTRGVLWAMVALRLAVPFSLKSAFSLIPAAEPIPKDIALMQTPTVETGIPAVNRAVNPVIVHRFAPDPAASVNPLQVVQTLAAVLWLAGVLAMLLFLLVSFLRAGRSVRAAIPESGGVYICDETTSPFVLGILRPRIYLPSDLGESMRKYVLLHEKAHVLRRDNWWKPLGFLILSVHWFNPLCWLAYILFCRDLEAACDERAVSQLNDEGRASYSQALLDCSRPRRMVTICPVAFGEAGVKGRVKSVLHYRRPILWVVLAALIVSAVAAVCFLTDPKRDGDAYEASLRAEETSAVTTPTARPAASPAASPTAEPTAEPTATPWAGDGHWYTFTVNTWGIMSSTGVKYLALYGPYSLWEDTAVAIGRIKGVPTEVKVYTGDPEERLIWAYVPEVFNGVFLREDVKLPDPDPETGVLAICLDGRAMILSEEARAELLSLQKAMETDGESAEHVAFSTVLGESDVTIELVYDEVPALRYCLWAICRYEGGWAMVTLKQVGSAEKYYYEPDRFLMLDPQGVICRDYLDSEAFRQAASDP